MRWLPIALALALPSCSTPGPPRLVVVVVVDQMRADFLTRFGPRFQAGFARLTAEGAVFTNANWDHAQTVTAPGHASLATGTHPALHGIVGNVWLDRTSLTQTAAVADPAVAIVGDPRSPGCSPVHLEREALGDWLARAQPASKVYSVALKDRSAILMGGRRPDGVFWYQPQTRRFVTSTHYMSSTPRWVDDLAGSPEIQRLFVTPWTLLRPESEYDLSHEDDFPAEGSGVDTTFPHDFERPALPGTMPAPASPFGDELALRFAMRLVAAEGLGADDVPDLLWIGASAADEIGHEYGPDSREIQDYYLRLDLMLGELLEFLDGRVGRGRYVVALSSDHGVAALPEDLVRRGTDARRIDSLTLMGSLQQAARRAHDELGIERPVPMAYVSGLVFDTRGVPADRLSELRRALAAELRKVEFVEDAYTYDELEAAEPPDRPYLEMYRRGFDADRSADVLLRFKPDYLISSGAPLPTNHGSPYEYDTHVPLILSGPGVRHGRFEEPVSPVDLAPTLARLLRIEPPTDLDGRPLGQALERGQVSQSNIQSGSRLPCATASSTEALDQSAVVVARARHAPIVFEGVVMEVGECAGGYSGMAAAYQHVTYAVKAVFKGSIPDSTVSVCHSILYCSDYVSKDRPCLLAKRFRPGSRKLLFAKSWGDSTHRCDLVADDPVDSTVSLAEHLRQNTAECSLQDSPRILALDVLENTVLSLRCEGDKEFLFHPTHLREDHVISRMTMSPNRTKAAVALTFDGTEWTLVVSCRSCPPEELGGFASSAVWVDDRRIAFLSGYDAPKTTLYVHDLVSGKTTGLDVGADTLEVRRVEGGLLCVTTKGVEMFPLSRLLATEEVAGN